MQACALTNRKPPSKRKKKKSRKRSNAVTPACFLKALSPEIPGLIFAINTKKITANEAMVAFFDMQMEHDFLGETYVKRAKNMYKLQDDN